MVDAVTKTRAARARDLEAWADRVSVDELHEADTRGLRAIAELVDQRDHVEQEITAAVRAARQADRSWSRSAPCSVSPSRRPNASTATSSPPDQQRRPLSVSEVPIKR